MSLRKLLAGLIVLATVCFVVGTTIERSSADTHHNETPAATSPNGEAGTHKEGSTGETARAPEARAHSQTGGETAGHSASGGTEKHIEARILGVDIEAVPFVILATLASLGLAAAVWRRPRLLLWLVAAVLGMLVFSALDIREIVHQTDENRTGLAVFAAVIALLHLAAAGTAGVMARQAQQPAA
jgi:hypothetical protein